MRGISLEEIAEATKIGTRSLRALEEQDFDKLPGGIFNKGFVRAYARYLGLDEEQAVADYLLPKALELRIFNTICDSTATRQTEARELARRSEAMVVIGGRNSANTRRLAEICRETGTHTIWVETAEELSPELLGDAERIGLTAGASTPQWIITDVIRRLQSLPPGGTGAGTHLPHREESHTTGGSTEHVRIN